MSAHLDPRPWFRLADTLYTQAERVRAAAVRIALRAEATHWYSPAAGQFRERAGSAALGMRAAADRMDVAADLARAQGVRLLAALDACVPG